MSSSSTSSTSDPPMTPAPRSRPHASSENLRISEAGPALDQRMERRRSTLPGPDRKRRLVNPEVVGGTRYAGPATEAGSSSRAEMDSRTIPRPSSHIQPNGAQPGATYDTAINLSSSPPESHSHRSPDHRRSSWSRGENHYVEYIRPRWQPDSEVTECPICRTTFSFWYRKHHCRKCGRVVCSSCSPHRITIPRQYIVHPPDTSRSPPSALGYTQAGQIVNLNANDLSQPVALNPALGGGEEVRLCNPCVPDPNPEPLLPYSAPSEIGSNTGWVRGPYVSQPSQSRHRSYHSLSTPARHNQYGIANEAFTTRPGRRTVGSSDYPAFNNLGGSFGSTFQERSTGYGSLSSSRFIHPSASSSRQSSYYPHGGASHSSPPGSSVGSIGRGVARRVPSHPRLEVDECDLCPICDNELPPIGTNGNEDAREAHIRNCIDNHGRSASSGSPVAQPPLPVRMLAYTATEKDCIGQDGTEQECTICMEEYEVGQSLIRLECLCKFHKRCIVEWFERKKECPVHKTS